MRKTQWQVLKLEACEVTLWIKKKKSSKLRKSQQHYYSGRIILKVHSLITLKTSALLNENMLIHNSYF